MGAVRLGFQPSSESKSNLIRWSDGPYPVAGPAKSNLAKMNFSFYRKPNLYILAFGVGFVSFSIFFISQDLLQVASIKEGRSLFVFDLSDRQDDCD